MKLHLEQLIDRLEQITQHLETVEIMFGSIIRDNSATIPNSPKSDLFKSDSSKSDLFKG